MLKKVISGGQTGADLTSLQCAKLIGLETGGTAPNGYKTERGPNLELRDKYGLSESKSSDYAVRTRQNVIDSDVTIWFGNTNSPGYWCTKNACRAENKPIYENPGKAALTYIVNTYTVTNIAGNRESKNRNVVSLTREGFNHIAGALGKEVPDWSKA